MEINFKGKIALVTGAGKGIGRRIAEALWKYGADVYALSRTQSDLDSLKMGCPGMHGVLADLQDWTETSKAIEGIGPVDLLVNNAARWRPTVVLDTSEENITTIFGVNVKAVVNVTQIVAKRMVSRGSGGAIVNISSIASRQYLSFGGEYLYDVSKAALDQLTRCQAVELGPYQIRVNSINPTVVRTPLVESYLTEHDSGPLDQLLSRMPISRWAEVKDVVNATLFLLSNKADMINGAILPVDGGIWCT